MQTRGVTHPQYACRVYTPKGMLRSCWRATAVRSPSWGLTNSPARRIAADHRQRVRTSRSDLILFKLPSSRCSAGHTILYIEIVCSRLWGVTWRNHPKLTPRQTSQETRHIARVPRIVGITLFYITYMGKCLFGFTLLRAHRRAKSKTQTHVFFVARGDGGGNRT